MNVQKRISYRLRLIADMWVLGNGFRHKLTLVVLCFALPVARKLNSRTNSGFRVMIRQGGRVGTYVVHDTIDLGELDTMFSGNEYELDIPARDAVRSIVDLGACSGASALFFGLTYPNATIYAIEPDPANCEKLRQVARANPDARIAVFNYALAENAGPVPFYISSTSGLSSSNVKREGSKQITVKGITLEQLAALVNEQRVDISKFDIEGGESLIEPAHFPKPVAVYVGEVHPDLMELSADEFARPFHARIERVPFGSNAREIIRAYYEKK